MKALLLGPGPIVFEKKRLAELEVRFAEIRIKCQGFGSHLSDFRNHFVRGCSGEDRERGIAAAEAGVNGCVARIFCESLLEILDGGADALGGVLVPEVETLEIRLICAGIHSGAITRGFCVLQPQALAREFEFERVHYGLGYFALNRERVARVALKDIGPNTVAVGGVVQMHGDANAPARVAHAALEHVADVQSAANFADIEVLSLKLEGRAACHHAQTLDAPSEAISSSVRPSLKYSSPLSPLRFTKGSTTREGAPAEAVLDWRPIHRAARQLATSTSAKSATVAKENEEGGTYVIPGHGHVCDRNDLANYRDMLTIIRERIADLVKKGKTLEQVMASKPTYDYDGGYGVESGPWTTNMFIEAVYREVTMKVQVK
jgi:hypothetical protein